jgi:hypothetical protein
MMKKVFPVFLAVGFAFAVGPGIFTLSAHCDAWDGPVVTEARQALQNKEVTPVLKWVSAQQEAEVVAAFERAIAVSAASEAAGELAELWFLETLVRLHRETEGAPYTGLKPAGQIDKAVALADRALEDGSVDALADRIGQGVANQIRMRFEEAAKRKSTASENPEAGRQFVKAYVDYVHFVEVIHNLLQHGGHSH